MPAHRIFWTHEMDAALVEGSSKNLGERRLAKIIGVDRRLVSVRRRQLGIPPAKKLGRPKKTETTKEPTDRLERILRWIDDPAARKIVIVNKAMRGELSNPEAESLIRDLGLVNA